jgi:hypothetical protein
VPASIVLSAAQTSRWKEVPPVVTGIELTAQRSPEK